MIVPKIYYYRLSLAPKAKTKLLMKTTAKHKQNATMIANKKSIIATENQYPTIARPIDTLEYDIATWNADNAIEMNANNVMDIIAKNDWK